MNIVRPIQKINHSIFISFLGTAKAVQQQSTSNITLLKWFKDQSEAKKANTQTRCSLSLSRSLARSLYLPFSLFFSLYLSLYLSFPISCVHISCDSKGKGKRKTRTTKKRFKTTNSMRNILTQPQPLFDKIKTSSEHICWGKSFCFIKVLTVIEVDAEHQGRNQIVGVYVLVCFVWVFVCDINNRWPEPFHLNHLAGCIPQRIVNKRRHKSRTKCC